MMRCLLSVFLIFHSMISLVWSSDEDFKVLHERGITGKGTKACIIESACHTEHPQFDLQKKEQNLYQFMSCSHIELFPGFQDFSLRYPQYNYFEIISGTDVGVITGNHGTHVAGILVGKPKKNESCCIEGGVVPDAALIVIGYSTVHLNGYWQQDGELVYGTALYTLKDVDENTKLDRQFTRDFNVDTQQYRDPNDGWFTTSQVYFERYNKSKNRAFKDIRSSSVYTNIIDDSVRTALNQAFLSGAKVINCSMVLCPICDPLHGYRIPDNILTEIEKGLVAHDQILVLAANNDNKDLSCFEQQVYFKQLANIPGIAERMLIVVNVAWDKIEGRHTLSTSSNWPGRDLSAYTVSALGENVVSGYAKEGADIFSPQSGTSMAAPKVTGHCLLTEQLYRDKRGQILTAPEIVNIIKTTASPIGVSEKFGRGLINPSALVELLK